MTFIPEAPSQARASGADDHDDRDDPCRAFTGHGRARYLLVMQNKNCVTSVAVLCTLALLFGGCMSNTVPAQSSTTGKAALENTYWKLVRLGATPVTVSEEQREPHFVLQPQTGRVVGSGGCNRLAGSYTLAGEELTFGQVAGTRMACPDGMDVERAFHRALGEVASWRIEGQTLELLDAAGVSIAQFESRDPK
jgi:heat shock protein HslJ